MMVLKYFDWGTFINDVGSYGGGDDEGIRWWGGEGGVEGRGDGEGGTRSGIAFMMVYDLCQ